MIVEEFFDHLTLGELKQVSVGGFADYGSVQQSDHKELLQHINLGLLQLYTRFLLNEKELVLQTREGRTQYPLEKKYAQSSGNPDWFIADEDMPFTEDVLRVQGIWYGSTELAINDAHNTESVYLPTAKCIQVPWATGAEQFSVIYRAAPEKLTEVTQEIPLPDMLIEPLLSYVEFRVRKSMGGEAHVALAAAARAQYESLVQAIEAAGILHTVEDNTCVKPTLGGWV